MDIGNPLNFWAWFYGVLVSPNYATFIPPTKCSGANCASYFLPGPIYVVEPSSSTFQDHTDATAFIVDDSIGYQIEFYPPLSTDNLENAKCETYGIDTVNVSAAYILCMKQSGNDLIVGMTLVCQC